MSLEADRQRVVDAYLRQMGRHPYAAVSLPMVAEAAGLTLGALRRTFASEEALLEGFAAWADAAMLDRVASMPQPPGRRARVVAAMMARFHILQPHRDAVRSILIGAAADPATLLFFGRVSIEEHRWTLVAAGLDHRGARSRNLAEAISHAFIAAAPAWLDDTGTELPATRAAVESALRFDDDALAAFEVGQA